MPLPSRVRASLVLLAALAACDRGPLQPPTATPGELPGDARFVRAAEPIPGRYIVVFRDGEQSSASSLAGEMVPAGTGKVHHAYVHALKGFAAELTPAAVQALLANPRVAYVAQDELVSLAETQSSATWGLDRVDQRDLPLDSTYTYTRTGNGVNVYVIDSGILTTHTEFGGRATVGTDLVGDGKNGQDCNGHGTHVAGTIGGATYGVAKGVNLISVRVFGCTGGAPFSTIIAAVDWVTANAVKPAVVNMSLSGGVNPATTQAVQNSIAAGITYAVAAGNNNGDACERSPASTPEALTVASSTSTDARSSFSNWGSCVDLFAPGSDITSAWWIGTTTRATISGTSMASPHVAGAAALYLDANPTAEPAAVAAAILNSASMDRVTDMGGSPNRLLYTPLVQQVLVVNPGELHFGELRPGSAGSPASGAPARQAFVAGGTGAARPEGAPPAGGVGLGAVSTQPLAVTNNGVSALAYTVFDSVSWLSASPASGTLAAGATDTLNVSVVLHALAAGTHRTTLVVTLGGHTRSIPVTVSIVTGTNLANGVPVGGLAGAHGSEQYFRLTVPAGADSLTIAISGGAGDADLHVRLGALPTTAEWDCRPWLYGNDERCAAAAPPGGDYYIMLQGYDVYSGVTLRATYYAAPVAPAAPSRVTAAGAGAGRVNVAWADSSGNEDLFRVRRSQRNADGTFAPYVTVGQRGPNNTSLLDTTVVLGATYRYQVQACNEAGCTNSVPSTTITIVNPPAAPSGLAGVVVPGGEVDLRWNDNSGTENQFRVRRGTRNPDGTFTAYSTLRTLPGGTTAYADTSAVPGRTYRYQVQACNVGGCANSGALVVTVPALPAAPTGVSGTAVSASQVNLAWTDASTNESQFRVRRTIRNPDGTYGPYVTIATRSAGVTSYGDTTVTAGALHRYIIQACNASGCSNSTAVNVPIPAS